MGRPWIVGGRPGPCESAKRSGSTSALLLIGAAPAAERQECSTGEKHCQRSTCVTTSRKTSLSLQHTSANVLPCWASFWPQWELELPHALAAHSTLLCCPCRLSVRGPHNKWHAIYCPGTHDQSRAPKATFDVQVAIYMKHTMWCLVHRDS